MTIATEAQAATPWCTIQHAQARAAISSGSFKPVAADTQPFPLHTAHVEGTLHPSETIRIGRRDLVLMRRAALIWRAGGDVTQFEVARRLMIAWVDTYRPSLNPIDETEFDNLIETFAILKDSLASPERKHISEWLGAWGWAYVNSIASDARPSHSIWINNWQSHRIKLVTMIAAATGDERLFAEARRLFRTQISANIHPDGETLDFYQRDALHYVVYDLNPLLRAALVARWFSGEDWYRWQTPDHASLARAVAWLTPYASGRITHEEFVKSTVDFDAQRAAAGVEGFRGLFDVHRGSETYWLASQFDRALEPLARTLGAEPDYLALCGN